MFFCRPFGHTTVYIVISAENRYQKIGNNIGIATMTKQQVKIRIEKLKKVINYHRYLYHVLDKQEISSSALDSLKKELFDLEQKFPEFITLDSPTQRIGGKVQKKFEKIAHLTPMLSLNDVFSEKEVNGWIIRIKKLLTPKQQSEIDFYCELKLDGIAIELIYKNGILNTGSTRGNGLVGENITQNLKTIEAIPLKLRDQKDILKDLKKQGLSNTVKFFKNGMPELIVRGEVFINKKDFEKINKNREKKQLFAYANPRNLAAGSIRQLNPKITTARNLNSYAYGLETDLGDKTHNEKHKILKILGFKVNPHNQYCKKLEQVDEFYKKTHKLREKLFYEIDGVVINVNNNNIFSKLGSVGKAPRGAVALKFPLKQTTTIIKDIKIQVGRTGALTPVAILKPVNIGGVMVSRATLHNQDEIKRLDVRIGDTVVVGRAGDVIPDVIKVLSDLRTGKEKRFKIINKCPVCNGEIKKSSGDVVVRCINSDCPARKKRYFYHFVSKIAFDIVGLGPEIINQLSDKGLTQGPADLFDLKSGDLLGLQGFAEKSAENLVNAIEQSKKVTLVKFIYSLGIRGVGEETAFDLAETFQNIENLKKASIEDFQEIPDIGPIVAQSIYQWFKNERNLDFLERLKKAGVEIIKFSSLKPVQGAQKFKEKTFVLTGILDSMNRNKAKQRIRDLGGDISSAVSQDTNFLIVGKNPGTKFQKAKNLKVKIIAEQEFLKML